MARARTGFGHDGFHGRIAALQPAIHARAAAENVARELRPRAQLVRVTLEAWLASPKHRKSLEGPYHLTGIGAAQAGDGTWYMTQIFVEP